MRQQLSKLTVLCFIGVCLSACAEAPVINYSPNDFVNPNRVITKKVPIHLPRPKVAATFGFGNDPQVIKAYREFTKTGIAQSIDSEGFKTLGFDAYSHPIIKCAPLKLCIVQLERGEQINNINIGDSAHWLIGTARIGGEHDGSYQVIVKPKNYDNATDLVITTDRRTYNLGLVSQQGAGTHVVRFYYPQETLSHALEEAKTREQHNDVNQSNIVSTSSLSTEPNVSVSHLNFHYKLSGDYPIWRPTRIFDDGRKTFIEMPRITNQVDLPVLYLKRKKKMQLVNYRYRAPYYIVDGLFEQAFLISGKGGEQVKVVIANLGLQGAS